MLRTEVRAGASWEVGLLFQRAVKRALDVAVSLLALTVLSPLLLTIAVAIKLTSRGPVLYRQRRVRHGGGTFVMLKFRTMVDRADSRLDEVFHLNEASGPFFKSRHDPRVTSVGRVLRRHFLDELPQLLNVLRGDMSLVGPRPCLAEEAARVESAHIDFRWKVPQGVTGPWQTSGHHKVTFEEQLRIERDYVQNWSIATDLVILAQTAWLVLSRKGL